MSKILGIISGGMDSTIMMRMYVKNYGAKKMKAISFNYGQKQAYELKCAKKVCEILQVEHEIIDISFLGRISKGFSANTDETMDMPTIKEVLGSPQPITYVPNRNMILMSIGASYAEVNKCNEIIMGLQVHDEYGYHDTTTKFVRAVNAVLKQNRTHRIRISAPFADYSKTEELKKLIQIDGSARLLKHTITCYNPTDGISCANCPSCSERIQSFMNVGVKDPIKYSRKINWRT